MKVNGDHGASDVPGKSDTISRIPYPYVPGIFYGTVDVVSTAWRPVFRRVLKDHSLRAVVAHSKPISILKSPGNMIITVQHGWARGIRGENYHFGECLRFVVEAVPVNVLARLMDEHADEFWMAVMVVSRSTAIQTLFNVLNPNPPKTASIVLRRLLRWWPELCGLGDRFSFFEQFSDEVLSVHSGFRDRVKKMSGWEVWGRSVAFAYALPQTRSLAGDEYRNALSSHGERVVRAGPIGAESLLREYVDRYPVGPDDTLASVTRSLAAPDNSGGEHLGTQASN